MEWARNSLVNSELSIIEIMDAIGYDHRNGFTNTFKKKYGCTPAEYRKNQHKQKGLSHLARPKKFVK
jgi:AraC-like DNA-binding protein